MTAAPPFDFEPMVRNGHAFVLDALNVVEAALLDYCDPVALDPETSARLAKLGVEGEALADLYIAPVCFDGARRFEFARRLGDDIATWRRSVVAVIIAARDEDDVAFDLVAWNLKTGAIATWRGEASLLGERNLLWRLGEEGLRVHPTVLDWLIAACDGLVILDADKARWRLIGEALIVTDPAFGRRLREAMRLPEPEIFVENKRKAA
jgi:hypothetical protein